MNHTITLPLAEVRALVKLGWELAQYIRDTDTSATGSVYGMEYAHKTIARVAMLLPPVESTAELPATTIPADRMPKPGVSLFDIAADIARTQQRMLTHDQRAEGRVISPRPQRPNIHD